MTHLMDEQSGIYSSNYDEVSLPEASQGATLYSGIFTVYDKRTVASLVSAKPVDEESVVKPTSPATPPSFDESTHSTKNQSLSEEEQEEDSQQEDANDYVDVDVLHDGVSMVSSLDSGGEMSLFSLPQKMSISKPAPAPSKLLQAWEEQAPSEAGSVQDAHLLPGGDTDSVDMSIFTSTYASIIAERLVNRGSDLPIQTYRPSALDRDITTDRVPAPAVMQTYHSSALDRRLPSSDTSPDLPNVSTPQLPILDQEVSSNTMPAAPVVGDVENALAENGAVSPEPTDEQADNTVASPMTSVVQISTTTTTVVKRTLPVKKAVYVFLAIFCLLLLLVVGMIFGGALMFERQPVESSSQD